MRRFVAAAALLTIALAGTAGHAQTVYPIDRAEILAGSRFDFKVEFAGRADEAKVAVTLNGEDYAKVFGKPAAFVEREDGKDQSALILRDVSLAEPGTYKVRVSDGALTRDHAPTACGRRCTVAVGASCSHARRLSTRWLKTACDSHAAIARVDTKRSYRSTTAQYKPTAAFCILAPGL